MSALTAARVVLVPTGTIKKVTYPLLANVQAYAGGMACFDTSAYGSVTKGAVSTTLCPIGRFLDSPALNASANQPIGVDLDRERLLSYWDSVTGAGAITVANLFQPVYIASDHELTTVTTGASIAGRVWAVNPQGYPGAIGIEMPFAGASAL